MPRVEPKQFKQEIERAEAWPLYWIYGPEKMKSRELMKLLRRTLQTASRSQPLWSEQSFDGAEVTSTQLIDLAQTPMLGGGISYLIVRDAEALKEPERLAELFGARKKISELTSVVVLLAKDLDQRRKFSKQLLERAAVVPCEAIADQDRGDWIEFLAKRREIKLLPQIVSHLQALEPFSLDLIDQELEKLQIASLDPGAWNPQEALQGSLGSAHETEGFLRAFFTRELQGALASVEALASRPEDAIPLLGLLGWNTRQLALVVRGEPVPLPPMLRERFQSWKRHWTLSECLELQNALAQIDFGIKQTPLLPLGLWSALLQRFCRLKKA
jgi:DNA polymerase III delta subunit